jgi:hypothetical protein
MKHRGIDLPASFVPGLSSMERAIGHKEVPQALLEAIYEVVGLPTTSRERRIPIRPPTETSDEMIP